MKQYRCLKCGEIWYSAGHPPCQCGGELRETGATEEYRQRIVELARDGKIGLVEAVRLINEGIGRG